MQARILAVTALPTESLTNVALEVGYASPSAFAEAFSQLIGAGPGDIS